MMLRFIYFVSLLLSLSLSEQEFIKPGKRHLRSCYKRGKINKKREIYNSFDDKESMDLIDVASFIQNPGDNSLGSNQGSKNRIPELNYGDDGLIMNEVERVPSQDYQGFDSDNIPEVNVYTDRRIPQYFNRKAKPTEEINGERVFRTNDMKNADTFLNTNNKNRQIEKKCALKSMKFPFFSRDQVSTAKAKKNKKRRLFSFHIEKKNSTKSTESNLNNKDINVKRKSIKVTKRSNFENLCPACRQRIMSASNDFLNDIRKTANSITHNSRQYYQQNHFEEADADNTEQPNYLQLNNRDKNSDKIINYISSKRRRRNKTLLKTRKNPVKNKEH